MPKIRTLLLHVFSISSALAETPRIPLKDFFLSTASFSEAIGANCFRFSE